MSVFVVNSPSRTLVSSFVGTLRAVAAKINAIGVALRHRRELGQLAGADAAMLRDLGLTPMDIDGALAEPLWRDPSHRLVCSVSERRLALKAAHRDNLIGLRP
ncbi:DUF1127 domain-containing protein [Labrys monachus]|uniref:Uncharacterized protein YjiS (DUF1127 family) n=1 Tax=Labrys monachus TaxID=217067 RepID=A0ABU0FAJ0_9HYPH|nr:hypothetical protein [Labrys monachus]MDQ0391566.1 uncharacterized protein YjiS (DUF1127 family) [Labrys monachus]